MSKENTYLSYSDLRCEALYALRNSPSPQADAERLLCHASGKSTAWLIAHGQEPACSQQAQHYRALIEQRKNGTPVAYLTQNQAFWNIDLQVTPDVLIPRADTETLIECALNFIDQYSTRKLLDLGTGSGAIACALAKERPQLSVLATDASPTALQVAQANARRLQLDNIQFQSSDWFSRLAPQKFDLIVSNPPYIADDDPHLQEGDLRFEPDRALISPNNGLHDLSTIIQNAQAYLNPNGGLLLEHGYNQAPAVTSLFEQTAYHNIHSFHDLNGHLRCTLALKYCSKSR